MKDIKLPWSLVVLVCFLTLILGWLVHDNKAPASVLSVPLGGLVATVAYAIGRAFGFAVGVNEAPPWLPQVMASMRPPPAPPPAPLETVHVDPPAVVVEEVKRDV